MRALRSLGLVDGLTRAIAQMGFRRPTAVQRRVIRPAIRGNNLVVSAETGSGKTAAYGLALLQRLHLAAPQSGLALVVAPSDVLARQIQRHLEQLAVNVQDRVRVGRDVVVGTPAGILARTDVDLGRVTTFVIDEADQMLALGHVADLKALYARLPRPAKKKADAVSMQTILVTATLVPAVDDLVRRFAPRHVLVDSNRAMRMPRAVTDVQFPVSPRRKTALVTYLLGRREGASMSLRGKRVLIFVRTRQRADRLAEHLAKRSSARVAAVHKDRARALAVQRMRDGDVDVLVATDVLARGIDIPDIDVVINFDVPHKPQDYLHRVGRTGRAGRPGLAMSLVAPSAATVRLGGRATAINETHFMAAVEKLIGRPVRTAPIPGPWRDDDRGGAESVDLDADELRNFQKSRYEDVITEFEARRARKAGMAVPKDIVSRLEGTAERRTQRRRRAKL